MEKNLTESQILNFYNDAKKLDGPIVGKIMVTKFEDRDGQKRWTKCYKIVEVGKGCFKVVDKRGYGRWYKKDKTGGYAEASMRDGKLHFRSCILRYRDHLRATYYDLTEGIDYTEVNPYQSKTDPEKPYVILD